jgi:hypothetical protein
MITDDVRREVAKELRELATPGCIRYAEEFYEELREIVASDLDGSFDGVANSLADLIDRPIYRPVIPNAMDGYVFCPQCGAPIGEYGVPNYCHSCGVAIRNGH